MVVSFTFLHFLPPVSAPILPPHSRPRGFLSLAPSMRASRRLVQCPPSFSSNLVNDSRLSSMGSLFHFAPPRVPFVRLRTIHPSALAHIARLALVLCSKLSLSSCSTFLLTFFHSRFSFLADFQLLNTSHERKTMRLQAVPLSDNSIMESAFYPATDTNHNNRSPASGPTPGSRTRPRDVLMLRNSYCIDRNAWRKSPLKKISRVDIKR